MMLSQHQVGLLIHVWLFFEVLTEQNIFADGCRQLRTYMKAGKVTPCGTCCAVKVVRVYQNVLGYPAVNRHCFAAVRRQAPKLLVSIKALPLISVSSLLGLLSSRIT